MLVIPLAAHERMQDEEPARLLGIEAVVGDAATCDDGQSEQRDALDAHGARLP